MGFDGFYLNSNNGKKFTLEDLQNLKAEDLVQNPQLQKLISLFDSDKSGKLEASNKQGVNELQSDFNTLKSHAGDDNILTGDELELFYTKNKKKLLPPVKVDWVNIGSALSIKEFEYLKINYGDNPFEFDLLQEYYDNGYI